MTFSPCLPEADPDRLTRLASFCQQHESSYAMTGQRGFRLHYCVYENPEKPLLLVSPGRMEATLKYRELAMDFWHQGFEVVVIDHRGQGLSQRFFNQGNVGHMDNFDYAALDLITLTQRCKKENQPALVIGHSMGASIALRAMQIEPNLFSAAAAMAPMLSLPLGMPVWIARSCTALKSWRDKQRWRRHGIVPGYISSTRREYQDPGFSKNRLTSSKVRYQAFRELYQELPELQLGGPSAGWLNQALILMKKIQADSHRLTQPLLVITAGQEVIVTTKGQNRLKRSLIKSGAPIEWRCLEQAQHEILEEKDTIRSAALAATLAHFRKVLGSTMTESALPQPAPAQ